jgi:hypothetical protein
MFTWDFDDMMLRPKSRVLGTLIARASSALVAPAK